MMHAREVSASATSSHPITTPWRFVVAFMIVAIALSVAVNLTWGLLIAAGTTTALAIGFAVKDLIAAFGGMLLGGDRPFKVGDRVSVGGVSGQIASIGLRSVRLSTVDDDLVTISNDDFLSGVVRSGDWGAIDVQIQTDFFVAIDQDVPLAKRLVGEALASCRNADTSKPWEVVAHQVLHHNVIAYRIRARAYVVDVQYADAFEADLSRRVATAFLAHDTSPPTGREWRGNRSVEPTASAA
jgi:small-conductance mechanosensitive channel